MAAATGLVKAQVRAGETVTVDDSEDPLAEIMALWSQPFLPNLLNTVTFLVETAQIIAVLFVNYKGRPWMVGGAYQRAMLLLLSPRCICQCCESIF